jgi:hypothetical protein
MTLVHINYWAVLVCGVASMVLGFIWYGPLFGKAWMKSIGINPHTISKEQIKKMQSEARPGYIAMFVGSLVMAFILKHFLTYAGAKSIGGGLVGALWIWLGFIATTGLGAKFFEKKPWAYYLINRGYDLVNLLVFSIVLVLWK